MHSVFIIKGEAISDAFSVSCGLTAESLDSDLASSLRMAPLTTIWRYSGEYSIFSREEFFHTMARYCKLACLSE
jgi:hypothetical protein